MYDLWICFILFMFYSIIGWILEVVDIMILKNKIVNRGFLIGPYCPIYGFGAIFMITLLRKYLHDPIALFVMAMIICGILEYITSYLMEKIFKARWWDYSKNKFNINGRICLENLVLFGLGGIVLMYIINPFIINILNLLPYIIINMISIIILIIFLTDFFISFKIIFEFKNVAKNIGKDSTEEINKYVKIILNKKSTLYRRLIKAFPNFQTKIKNIIKN